MGVGVGEVGAVGSVGVGVGVGFLLLLYSRSPLLQLVINVALITSANTALLLSNMVLSFIKYGFCGLVFNNRAAQY